MYKQGLTITTSTYYPYLTVDPPKHVVYWAFPDSVLEVSLRGLGLPPLPIFGIGGLLLRVEQLWVDILVMPLKVNDLDSLLVLVLLQWCRYIWDRVYLDLILKVIGLATDECRRYFSL